MGDCERGWEIGNRETNRETNLQSWRLTTERQKTGRWETVRGLGDRKPGDKQGNKLTVIEIDERETEDREMGDSGTDDRRPGN